MTDALVWKLLLAGLQSFLSPKEIAFVICPGLSYQSDRFFTCLSNEHKNNFFVGDWR